MKRIAVWNEEMLNEVIRSSRRGLFFAHFCSLVPMDRQTQIFDCPKEGNRVARRNAQISLQITTLRIIFHGNIHVLLDVSQLEAKIAEF